MGIAVGEKGTYPARVSAIGEAGHASMPALGPQRGAAAGRAAAPGRQRHAGRRSPVVDRMVAVLQPLGRCPATPTSRSALAARRGAAPALEHLVPAVAGITMAPTMLAGSSKRNVMPGRASVELDCRILPGTTEADVEREVRGRLGDGIPYELDWPEQLVAGSSSRRGGSAVRRCASRSWTTATRARCCCRRCRPASPTRSTCARPAAPSAYGFSPIRSTPADVALAGFHNDDERVHVDDLLLAVQFHEHAARTLLT